MHQNEARVDQVEAAQVQALVPEVGVDQPYPRARQGGQAAGVPVQGDHLRGAGLVQQPADQCPGPGSHIQAAAVRPHAQSAQAACGEGVVDQRGRVDAFGFLGVLRFEQVLSVAAAGARGADTGCRFPAAVSAPAVRLLPVGAMESPDVVKTGHVRRDGLRTVAEPADPRSAGVRAACARGPPSPLGRLDRTHGRSPDRPSSMGEHVTQRGGADIRSSPTKQSNH